MILSSQADEFVSAAKAALSQIGPQVMLTEGIASAYRSGRDRIAAGRGVSEVLAAGSELRNASPYLFRVSAGDWLANRELSEEVFGPLGLIVTGETADEFLAVAKSLEGQLTATLHLDAEDSGVAHRLMPILQRKAGRILANGFPTGKFAIPWSMTAPTPPPLISVRLQLGLWRSAGSCGPYASRTFRTIFCLSILYRRASVTML